MSEPKGKQAKTRVAERLATIKGMLHARVVVELSSIEALVDACLADLTPKKKRKKP